MVIVAYFASVAAALATLGLGGYQTLRKLRAAEERTRALQAVLKSQSDNTRMVARHTLRYRRALAKLKHELGEIDGTCRQLEREIAVARERDRLLLVLDERRRPSDQAWLARVVHPDYRELICPAADQPSVAQWQVGRRCLVWAADQDEALDKIMTALPPEQGYRIGVVSLLAQPEPTAPAAGDQPAESAPATVTGET